MSIFFTARHATEEPACMLHGGLPKGAIEVSPSRNEVHPNIVTNYDPKHVNHRGENLRTPFFFILPSLASLLNGCSWKYGRWRKEKIPLYAFYEELFVVVVKFLVV